jgi:hypothetical protein
MCVTMTESTLGHCYHFIHECHNDAKYFGTLLSSYTCVSQWHNVHWHIVIISYMCGTMTPSALTHCYNLIPVCHNDTKYIDTLLSSYTCVPQWHKVDWYIVIILYMCVTMTQRIFTHCYHLIHVCHNDIYTLTHCYHLIPVCYNKTKYIDTKGNIFSG